MTTPSKLDGAVSAALREWRESPDAAPDAAASVNLIFTGDLAAIEALGFEAASVVGDQALGIVRFRDIPKLVEHPGVLWLSGGTRRQKHLDVAVRDVRARATAPISGPPVDGVWHATVDQGTLTSVPKATGKGVIVAIMDTGIDYTHPMFIVPGSSPMQSRILKIWDQGLTPTSFAECPDVNLLASSNTMSYGVEFDRAQIETALNGGASLRHRDCDGHGTHVAGIAAGGTEFLPVFGDASKVGVAPEADIIVVKYLDPPEEMFYRKADNSVGAKVLDAAPFQDGVMYCLRTARALGKSVVINMSFGSSAMPGDGLDDDARWVDAVLDPNHAPGDLNFPKGAIVVNAAGNDGNNVFLAQIYRIDVPAAGEIIVPLILSDSRGELQTSRRNCEQRHYKPDVGVHFWYRRAPAPLSVQFAARLPHGGIFGSDVMVGGKHELGVRPIVGPPPNDIAVAFAPHVHRFTIDHQDNPPVAHRPGGPLIRRQYVHFFVSPKVDAAGTASYHTGIYEMRIRAPANTVIFMSCDMELWSGLKGLAFSVNNTMQDGTTAPHANVVAISESSAVDTMGRHVITVASYDDTNGDATQLAHHCMADSSSRGPLRDYSDPANPLPVIPKPDISAPGVSINSAASFDGEGLIHWPWWYLGDRYEELGGTSMASPIVAGAVALMLQKNPNLNATDVRTHLSVTTRQPGAAPPFQLDITLPPAPSPGPAAATDCGAGMLDVLASHKHTP